MLDPSSVALLTPAVTYINYYTWVLWNTRRICSTP
jgi:hypothetical protein